MTSTRTPFVARYGGIYEHSPWVAIEAEAVAGDIDDVDRLAEIMADCVDNASRERQLELIRAHPELAAKVSPAGALTAESTSEQASAGLDGCSAAEFARFRALNSAYREKFGFPFVMAVRGSSRQAILRAFESRLGNDAEMEFETALGEIHKIARLRLRALAERQ